MSDIIKLLPDKLANQIAAGEVIQRPASVIKELLENAIDAHATDITLIVKDAGKELIQVIDNGKGMSPMDARMCFERHATSKISNVDDLFAIKTMGFRGEAMASIAAVAHIDMKTKPSEEDLGTQIVIEGGQVLRQDIVACSIGTNISVKNLFFNVPARRKFLKANTTELKHILDEFIRVAMAYPHIAFKFFNNDSEQYHLRIGSLKNRIIELLGNRFEKSLINVTEDTEYLKIEGFVGKPETATKTRGNQFFFVNNRFIRSPYLHHAVANAYQELIEKDTHPFYVLFFEIDPQRVDVNVHPTKQEVKFEDDQILYAYLLSAVKHSLARFNIAPSLDFTLDTTTQNLDSLSRPANNRDISKAAGGYLSSTFTQGNKAHLIEKSNSREQWQAEKEQFFNFPVIMPEIIPDQKNIQTSFFKNEEDVMHTSFLMWNEFLITNTQHNLLFIHIKRAQQRVIYDQMEQAYESNKSISQQLLFPEMIELSSNDFQKLMEINEEMRSLGFDLSNMGNNTIAINALPVFLEQSNSLTLIEEIIENAHHDQSSKTLSKWRKIANATAKRAAHNWHYSEAAAHELTGKLFSSQNPSYTPDGLLIIHKQSKADMTTIFGR